VGVADTWGPKKGKGNGILAKYRIFRLPEGEGGTVAHGGKKIGPKKKFGPSVSV